MSVTGSRRVNAHNVHARMCIQRRCVMGENGSNTNSGVVHPVNFVRVYVSTNHVWQTFLRSVERVKSDPILISYSNDKWLVP